MNRNVFLQMLHSGTLCGLFVFEGKEEYLKEQTLREIETAVLPEGLEAMNETILENTDVDKLCESTLALPFMCDKRLVVAKDPGFLKKKSRGGKKDEESENESKVNTDLENEKEDASLKDLAQKVSQINDIPTCITILYLRSNFERIKSKVLQIEDKVVSFDFLQEYELNKWVKDEFKKQNCAISNEASYELIRGCGTNMGLLELEINKLTAYKGKNARIELDDVQKLVTPDLESSVLKMIDALLSGNQLAAYRILNSMTEHGESKTLILYMLTRQIRLMWYVREMHEKSLNEFEIKKNLELKDRYPVSITQKQAELFSKEILQTLYQRSVEYEADIKSGKIGESQGLDAMLTLLNSMRSKHKGTKPYANASNYQR